MRILYAFLNHEVFLGPELGVVLVLSAQDLLVGHIHPRLCIYLISWSATFTPGCNFATKVSWFT